MTNKPQEPISDILELLNRLSINYPNWEKKVKAIVVINDYKPGARIPVLEEYFDDGHGSTSSGGIIETPIKREIFLESIGVRYIWFARYRDGSFCHNKFSLTEYGKSARVKLLEEKKMTEERE